MDALALLCHLAADGTATLTRLRHAGYGSLQDVLLAEDDELGEVIGVGSQAVRRLRREAESLEDRMGDSTEAEPSPPLSSPTPKARSPRPGERPTPLLCQLEVDPLTEDEEPAAASDPEPQPEPASESRPSADETSRFWMPIARDEADAGEPQDPGSSGPFA